MKISKWWWNNDIEVEVGKIMDKVIDVLVWLGLVEDVKR